ncbi:hypothetical protein BHE74_00003590 [Ensete ventricosum]|nr:hypothetical protein BHE74_00003590 [Ensete ventricosum]
MAGRGVTLVLRTSWFNRSSWICAKEITAIGVYGGCTFTSPRISGFRPSIKSEPHGDSLVTPRGVALVEGRLPDVVEHLKYRGNYGDEDRQPAAFAIGDVGDLLSCEGFVTNAVRARVDARVMMAAVLVEERLLEMASL